MARFTRRVFSSALVWTTAISGMPHRRKVAADSGQPNNYSLLTDAESP
ncbi:MAG TPA: hypothetical protein VMH22_03345 [bacterium]|nr:hypothetical protein [bacterium]